MQLHDASVASDFKNRHTGDGYTEVIKHLKSMGHDAVAPTLIGNGPDAEKKGHTIMSTVVALVDWIKYNNFNNFVLVGHSYGGTIIQKVVEVGWSNRLIQSDTGSDHP